MAENWQEVMPLSTEDPDRPADRRVDVVALVAGIAFGVLALASLGGLEVPFGLLAEGGVFWILLIAAGVALLVSELRARRRSGGQG